MLTVREPKRLSVLAQKPVATATVVISRQHKGKKRKFRRVTSGRVRGVMAGQGGNFLAAYVNTLNDPFEYSGLKLGYDCLVDSTIAVGYLRLSIATNADGSFAVYSYPAATGNFLTYNNAGAATATWNGNGAANVANLTATFSGARVISGGIRVRVNYPLTSAPGTLFAGTVPMTSYSVMNTLNPTNLVNQSFSDMIDSSREASALMRPQDNDSFVFYVSNLTGWTAGSQSQMSIPFIAGLGFPASTTVWIEAVQNYECLANVTANGSSFGSNTPNPEPVAADYFASPERLFRAAQSHLTPAALADAADKLGKMASGVATVRKAFGLGRNWMNARRLYGSSLLDGSSSSSSAPFGVGAQKRFGPELSRHNDAESLQWVNKDEL